MLQFRELESTRLFAGLGVQLLDEHTNEAPFGWTSIELDVDEGGTWRTLDRTVTPRRRTAGGITWFPWLEHHRDARTLAPRKYRVRVDAELSVPRYRYDSEGVEVWVAPYDDDHLPSAVPIAPIVINLLPRANYPFAPAVPVVHGAVIDINGDRVPDALVSWHDPPTPGDVVLSDEDGEFSLPMRRAPQDDSQLVIAAERPPPPALGRSGDVIVRLPSDLNTFFTIQIL